MSAHASCASALPDIRRAQCLPWPSVTWDATCRQQAVSVPHYSLDFADFFVLRFAHAFLRALLTLKKSPQKLQASASPGSEAQVPIV
jgi:hypothetical protein